MNPSFQSLASLARQRVITAIFNAKKGHIGGALSSIDLMLYLYLNKLVTMHPGGSTSVSERPFVLSKAHSATGLLAVISVLDKAHESILDSYNTGGSLVGNNPSEQVPGVEFHAGSLGHGISFGAGLALAKKLGEPIDYVTVFVSDGELHEGSCWEGLLFIAHHDLDVCVIVDNNHQICEARTDSAVSLGHLEGKFKAFGFTTLCIDGHSLSDLRKIDAFITGARWPRAIVADTIKGKGVSFMEKVIRFHHSIPSREEFDSAMAELRAS